MGLIFPFLEIAILTFLFVSIIKLFLSEPTSQGFFLLLFLIIFPIALGWGDGGVHAGDSDHAAVWYLSLGLGLSHSV